MNRKIDHIVYCVQDLEAAIEDIYFQFGVKPVIGGRHLTKGTKNALLNLGNKCYLEILAVDEENEDFQGARWMGIDLIDKPLISRWSLKSEDLERDSQILRGYALELAQIDGGKRQTADGQSLAWEMILPHTHPEVEVLPFMTDWSQSEVHPTDSLAEGCKLLEIELFHPNPSAVQPVISKLGLKLNVKLADQIQIVIEVQTPNGIKTLK